VELSQSSVAFAVLGSGKRCAKCERILPYVRFHKRQDSRDGYNSQCAECRSNKGKDGATKTAGGRLPLTPFRKWLKERLQVYGGSTSMLALATGMNERQLYRCLNRETSSVQLDIVDKALTLEGSTFLWELGYREIDFKRADKVARARDPRSSV